MSPTAISLMALASIFGGTLLGMFLRAHLPDHHLSIDSKDVMKLGIGMIATMAAVVLGLVIGSAKSTFDTLNSGLTQNSSKIILLDRTLSRYGPKTKEARDILKRYVNTVIELIGGKKNESALEKAGQAERGLEDLDEKLRQLSPRNDDQRRLQSRALQIIAEITETHWLQVEHVVQSSFPMPLLVLLVCWLTIIFFSFGLFTPRNRTVITVLFVCALSAASSLFLILNLDQPFGGLIKISSAPLLNALSYLGQ